MSRTDKLIIPTREGYEFIEADSILYCEANGNRCKIQTYSRTIQVSKPLKNIEKQLSEVLFFRVHQSFLVNVEEVTKYIKGKGGYVVLSNGCEIKIAESRREDVLRKLYII